MQWELIKLGAGVGMVPVEVGDTEPSVVRVFEEIAFPVPFWLTTHREVNTSSRVRTVFDYLATQLAR